MAHPNLPDGAQMETQARTSFEWDCNLATHCRVFVQLCLRKTHLFSGVEGHIHSVT